MLWDLIRDFFVVYIFGGFDSYLSAHSGFMGLNLYTFDELYTDNFGLFQFKDYNGDIVPISLGDYFSTISTIITLIVIILVCFHIIKKCFNVFTRIL